jgi:dTDP-4-dehydrorhamnose 3,5-epimerase
MIVERLAVRGAYRILMERIEDSRGYFARTWSAREAADLGLQAEFVQANVSFNPRRGTLRGLHYQEPPHEEVKLVRCTRGRLYDVVLDLRPDSPTYLAHAGVELGAGGDALVYVPRGCAHGLLTLEDSTEVSYLISAYYAPEAARGVRWNDPAFGIAWPGEVRVISERDRGYPDFAPGGGIGRAG